MFDLKVPSEQAFFRMLGNAEVLYFLAKEVDYSHSHDLQSAFEIPFRTALTQLHTIANSKLPKQNESIQNVYYNEALIKIE
ncbi:hypothetical protein [Paenibacillus polymyxa]|uniref:Uncharacterized protein n=1 Tax=Paenibacillus polymyxa (strain SC2) TaxID=886882 RepID=E3EKY4_PAEPS|nr:hypothetical protein [Paenibacillus polymyxa]ADO59889.1 hypothetical protein PPSC2_28715 [Paenibacillus polymyxa SC2]WPQ59885.1 hypothetical protein SKN87_26725 [Paenibacillus polymyxa]